MSNVKPQYDHTYNELDTKAISRKAISYTIQLVLVVILLIVSFHEAFEFTKEENFLKYYLMNSIQIILVLVILRTTWFGLGNFLRFINESSKTLKVPNTSGGKDFMITDYMLSWDMIDDMIWDKIEKNEKMLERFNELRKLNPSGVVLMHGFFYMDLYDEVSMFSGKKSGHRFMVIINFFGKDTLEIYQFNFNKLFPEFDDHIDLIKFIKSNRK